MLSKTTNKKRKGKKIEKFAEQIWEEPPDISTGYY